MHPISHAVIALLVLIVGAAALPPAASAAPIAVEDLQFVALTAMPDTISPNSGCLTLGEMVAIIAGGVVGWATADAALSSSPFAILGMAAGAALGSLWYRFSM